MSASPPRRLLAFAVIVCAITFSLLGAVGASGRSEASPSLAQEPSISGTPIVGHTLKGNRGTWNGTAPLTYAPVWVRCDENAQSCNPISGATTANYTIISADVGSTLRFRVTAKNADGSQTADSNPTGVVGTASGVPVSSKPPVLAAQKVEVGFTLSTTTGTWVGSKPITFSYHWQRCDAAGNACNGISGATNATYTLVGPDAGHTVRVKVTGANSKGHGSAISDQSPVVAAAPGGGGGGGGGGNSVDAGSLTAGDRLVVESVTFSPNPVTSRSEPIRVTIKVTDDKGKNVKGALVFFRSTPILTSTPTDAPTDSNGIVVYTVTPRSDFPLKTGYSVQFYAKAYRKSDPTLAGVAGTRLVQVATHS